ncbi:MAG: DNA alkylation repair protein [Phycisphaerales bacterium]
MAKRAVKKVAGKVVRTKGATRETASAARDGSLPTAAMILKELKALGDPAFQRQMSERFGISGATQATAFGVSMKDVQAIAKRIKKDGPKDREQSAIWRHELAAELWATGQYDARQMAPYVDVPALVTAEQMERWAKGFDNWATCDTACFTLFDRVPPPPERPSVSIKMIRAWAKRKEEFVKRAAFATIAGMALHDKKTLLGAEGDAVFVSFLPLIEAAANDERNFVKKGVSWALRGIGKRNERLCKEAITLATKLSKSEDKTERWIGKDALRDLT